MTPEQAKEIRDAYRWWEDHHEKTLECPDISELAKQALSAVASAYDNYEKNGDNEEALAQLQSAFKAFEDNKPHCDEALAHINSAREAEAARLAAEPQQNQTGAARTPAAVPQGQTGAAPQGQPGAAHTPPPIQVTTPQPGAVKFVWKASLLETLREALLNIAKQEKPEVFTDTERGKFFKKSEALLSQMQERLSKAKEKSEAAYKEEQAKVEEELKKSGAAGLVNNVIVCLLVFASAAQIEEVNKADLAALAATEVPEGATLDHSHLTAKLLRVHTSTENVKERFSKIQPKVSQLRENHPVEAEGLVEATPPTTKKAEVKESSAWVGASIIGGAALAGLLAYGYQLSLLAMMGVAVSSASVSLLVAAVAIVGAAAGGAISYAFTSREEQKKEEKKQEGKVEAVPAR